MQLGTPFPFAARGLSDQGKEVPARLEWTADGGTISEDGVYVGTAVGPFKVIVWSRDNPQLADTAFIAVWENPTDPTEVLVEPDSVEIEIGDTVAFSASFRLANGSVVSTLASGASVTWSSQGGQIESNGRFTATVAGTYRVSASVPASGTSSVAASHHSKTSTVLVRGRRPGITRIVVEPASISLKAGQTALFTATSYWSDGASGPGDVTWSATGGAITSSGSYTAGSQPGTYMVVAKGAGSNVKDTSVVSISAGSPASPTLTALTISPEPASVPAGGSLQFSVSATWSDGSATLPSLSWSATGGTVSSSGLYTAGATSGSYRVVVAGGGRADTAAVTVSPVPQAPTLESLTVSPQSVSLPVGAVQQFTVVARWSDGSSTVPAISWTATGGTISGGLYGAGTAAGTYRVIAAGGGKADTAAVALTAPDLPPPPPLPAGCANAQPGWIWCDDFEQDLGSAYFEYDNDGGDFVRAAGVGINGSAGMRARWEVGEVAAGNLKLAFGRTPSSYMRPVDGGTGNYRELYWRVLVRNQPGWVGGGADKLSRAMVLAGSNWSQAMAAHVWSAGSGNNYLAIDPASGTDVAGNLRTTGYNDGANFRWLGIGVGQTPIFSAGAVGQWYCVEAHARLNSAGQSDGVFELWINNALESQRTGLNWVGSYNSYGINALFLENYWNNGSPAVQERYFDDLVVSTQRIGCSTASNSPTKVLTELEVSPSVASISTGGTHEFRASARWSDGSTAVPAISWSANGGTVSSSGTYTAGATPGTYRIIASGGGRTDTATVAVSGSASADASFTLSPASVTLVTGATQQFQASAQWSDGKSRPFSVSYSATGGAISVGGLFLAGQITGAFSVIASCDCGKADTSIVLVTAPVSATLVSLTISPTSLSLSPGATQQFTAAALWSNGSTALPALSWSATGGMVTGAGLYTAGATAGTYQVTATGGGLSTTVPVTLTGSQAPASSQPAVVEDFSTYTSEANFRADPRGIYVTWSNYEDKARYALDQSVGLNAGGYNLTQSMRYDYFYRADCQYETVGRAIELPGLRGTYGRPEGQYVKELWSEIWVRFAPNFTVNPQPGCNSQPEWKTIFHLFNTDGWGRAGWHWGFWGTFQFYLGGQSIWGPNGATYTAGGAFPGPYVDGQWHRFRWYTRMPSNAKQPGATGVMRAWIDDRLVMNESAWPLVPYADSPADVGFLGVALGRNMGPPSVNTSVWWGRVALYTSNPGW